MANPPKQQSEFDLAVFITKHQRQILSGGAAVLILGGAGWFWQASQNLKETRAEQALGAALQAYYSGNSQLADADLGRVVQRYGGTSPGVRAAMTMAQSFYEQERHADGVAVLQEVVGRRAAKPFRAAVHGLIGVGLENQSKFDEAAAAFGEAADAAQTRLDRDSYRIDRARALTSAGKRADALKIWQAIADQDGSPFATEARLRVAELSAAPATKG